MTDLLEKCTVCGALVDEEDLFCANCGTEAPHRVAPPVRETLTHGFACRGCGASMSYDASAQALRCPFCGSERLEESTARPVLSPHRCLPFSVSRKSVMAALKRWLGASFWRPSDLATQAQITRITPIYVPYWVFQAETYTYWTADTNQTPPGARGDWAPMAGHHRGKYQGVLIGASSVLTPAETGAICPYDLAPAVPPDQLDLENAIVEQFQVQRKYARPLARHGLETMEQQACLRYVPGRARNLKVNVRLSQLRSEPVLVPVWILVYRYHEQVYRFLINGQTGRCWGTAPVSYARLIKILAIVAGIGLGIVAITALVATLFQL